MRILFICSRNRLRSPTAEAVFAGLVDTETMSAGTALDAETPVSADLIEWADLIVAMEAPHRKRLRTRFPDAIKSKRLIVLGILDRYAYMDPDLISLLEQRLTPFLSSLKVR